MIETRIARRYAQAIFSIAEDKGAVDQYLTQLEEVVQTVTESGDLARVFGSRLTNTEKKKELVVQLFSSRIDKNVLNFILLVLDKGRGGYLADILANYQKMTDDKQQVCPATVISALPFEKEQESALTNKLKTVTGKEIRLTKETDPNILGGFKLVIGDLHYDASVAGQLNAMQQQLVR